ncbi:uncharacterized protein A1O9_06645 [Exophiala aquamarina CBS 119918]|uniref:Xylanolytic transcriptional activator regulatory domain-containing protein n=1 Tax=Exophiala aquamarina CBS 119918 TaxID=1182545 RepID=A0A072PF27_9EURO|nr:uncharacterized protein A1O9_06645 [Exophiala aquamarina CBS 119918]KEF58719.1 hypothetical protein A1O9_06645 [Exophiala aquamarina CBS 119918]
MTEKLADYEKLLKDLMSRVGDADASLIRASLEKETLDDPDEPSIDSRTDASVPIVDGIDAESESGAESLASAGAGSTGALDRTNEDFTREEARSTGFMGKNSEITWLQRVQEENKYGDDEPAPHGGEARQRMGSTSAASLTSSRAPGDPQMPLAEADLGFSINDTSYHLDDVPITTFEAVDPYEMPSRETAQHLFNAYIARVHPSFPIVGKLNLSNQFQKFISGTVQRPPEKWLAIINLIFAIGATYSHLIEAEWAGDERDHLIYFTRARMLSMNSETIFHHPDLQQIQILGLMTFYLMCISQINRAWILNGIAIREAGALAMNMRNDSVNLKDSLKEIRYRVWWALYTLEHRLCSMTGRVNCILDDHCTAPLPAPLEEEQFETAEGLYLLSKERQRGDRAPSSNPQSPGVLSTTPSSDRSRSQNNIDSRSPSTGNRGRDLEWAKDIPPNSSLYFLHLVQLARLTQDIFHKLYNPSSITGSWSDVQAKIKELDERLEHWYRRLPPAFVFRRKQRGRNSYEARLALGFTFFGAKMAIHRPCLCRLDRKIPHQSSKSLDFNRISALACVEAAMELLRSIPDEPNAVGLMRVGPWWSILHFLVQATTILMLEISFRVNHMPEAADQVFESGKKSIRWLHALGEENASAKRAWALCFPVFRDSCKRIGLDASDLPHDPPGKYSPAHPKAAMPDFGFSQSIFAPATIQSTMFPPASNAQSFAMYDSMMQYDQYFPPDLMIDQHQQGNPPTDAEIEFMSSVYHDNQGHGQSGSSQPGPLGGQSSRQIF